MRVNYTALNNQLEKQYAFGKGPEYETETAKLQAENRYLKQQIEVLKKARRVGDDVVPKIVVQLVEELSGIMPITEICKHLGVLRSTYYRWKMESGIEIKKDKRDQKIGELCLRHKYRYGYRKITSFLHSDQGSVYTSYAYQYAVKEKGITMSMSLKGTPLIIPKLKRSISTESTGQQMHMSSKSSKTTLIILTISVF